MMGYFYGVNRSTHLYLIWIICCFSTIATAQVIQSPQWQNTIGSYLDEIPTKVIPTIDGGYLLAGHSKSTAGFDKTEANLATGKLDYWVVKVDSEGNKIWDEVIGGLKDDGLVTSVRLMNGTILLGGYSDSEVGYDKTDPNYNLTTIDGWLVCIDDSANVLWDKTYGCEGTEKIHYILPTSDGGALLCLESDSEACEEKTENCKGGDNDPDFWILKIDSLGLVQWQNTIGGSNTDIPAAAIELDNGDFMIVGNSNSPSGFDKTADFYGAPDSEYADYWIVYVDQTGHVVFDKTIGGYWGDYPKGIVQMSNANLIIIGSSTSPSGADKTEESFGGSDVWVVCIDTLGELLWDAAYGGMYADAPVCADIFASEQVLISGFSSSPPGPKKTAELYGESDYWMISIDSIGTMLWDVSIGCAGEDVLTDVFVVNDTTVVWCGYSNSDTCSFKDELQIGVAVEYADYFVAQLSGYNEIAYSLDLPICNGDSVQLPDGTYTNSVGVYDITLEGPYIDSHYSVHVESVGIDTSVFLGFYWLEAMELDGDAYVWVECSDFTMVLDSSVDQSFYPFASGNYACIIYKEGCVDTTSCVDIALGITNNTTEMLSSYPNPGDGAFYLQGFQSGTLIEIRNLHGQVIYSAVSTQPEAMIDIKEQASGIYRIVATYKGKQTELRYLKLQ